VLPSVAAAIAGSTLATRRYARRIYDRGRVQMTRFDRELSMCRGSYPSPMVRLFYVASCGSRQSIREHGLDSSRMGAVPGIAGSRRPAGDGVFVCRDDEFFVAINNTGGPSTCGPSTVSTVTGSSKRARDFSARPGPSRLTA
jgi:hypothetical protein